MRQAAGESLRVRRVGRGEHGRPRGDALLGQTVMHVGRRQQAEADMIGVGLQSLEPDVRCGCQEYAKLVGQEPRAARPIHRQPVMPTP